MTDDAVTRWWWIRHAPVTDHGGRIYGQSDVPCDTSDTAAFTALASMLPAGAVWLTSHLKRTDATARAILAAGAPGPAAPDHVLVEPDLAEQHFGRWQDTSWDALHAAEDPDYAAFWDNPGRNAPPGGESFADLIARVAAVTARINGAYAGRDIVAVCHGGTIRAAVATALAAEPVLALGVRIDNLTLTRIDHLAGRMFKGQGGNWRVAGVNIPPHFKP